MARRSLAGRFRGIDESDEDTDTEPPDSAESPESSGGAHLVMVHVDESALRGKGGASDLPIKTVKRLLCDGSAAGVVENGNGEPLSIGRKSRTVPTAIRRALAHEVAGRAPHRALDRRRRNEPRLTWCCCARTTTG